jgi:hypothetical protein
MQSPEQIATSLLSFTQPTGGQSNTLVSVHTHACCPQEKIQHSGSIPVTPGIRACDSNLEKYGCRR